MAENDIYNSKGKYERFVERFIKNKEILNKPIIREKGDKKGKGKQRKYYCKNKENLKYYEKLIRTFEGDDLSYIRRMRLFDVMNFLTYFVECDLKNVNGLEKEKVILEIRKVVSPSQIRKTSSDIRRIGKVLFYNEDLEDNESDIPKFFRTFKLKTDISRQKARKDKINYDEFNRLVGFFSDNTLMKAYLTIAFETLARPQELLYSKIENVELFDRYAYIHISEHGKEGIKTLLVIDSYPYLLNLLNQHKDKNNKKAYLFLNGFGNQLTPKIIGIRLKTATKQLKIDKPITAYTLKRFGITYRRLKGEDDITIQRLAGWTSTRQMKTYDMSNQKDVFNKVLEAKGLVSGSSVVNNEPKTKLCEYCGELVGFAEKLCPRCKRSTDKEVVRKEIKEKEELLKKMEVFSQFYEKHKIEFEEILNKEK